MREISFLESDQDFENLLPLVKEFSELSKVPYWEPLHEITASFTNSSVFVILGKDEGKITAYLCGYYLNKEDFMMSQTYSKDPQLTKLIGDFLDDHLRSVGIKRIIVLFKHDPRIAEKHGFKIERYLMTKNIEKGEPNDRDK